MWMPNFIFNSGEQHWIFFFFFVFIVMETLTYLSLSNQNKCQPYAPGLRLQHRQRGMGGKIREAVQAVVRLGAHRRRPVTE